MLEHPGGRGHPGGATDTPDVLDATDASLLPLMHLGGVGYVGSGAVFQRVLPPGKLKTWKTGKLTSSTGPGPACQRVQDSRISGFHPPLRPSPLPLAIPPFNSY